MKSPETGLRKKKEVEAVVPCASCGFHRGDRAWIPGLVRGISSANHELCKVVVKGSEGTHRRASPAIFPMQTPDRSSQPMDIYNMHVLTDP